MRWLSVWSAERRAELLRAYVGGATCRDLASQYGRCVGTIQHHLWVAMDEKLVADGVLPPRYSQRNPPGQTREEFIVWAELKLLRRSMAIRMVHAALLELRPDPRRKSRLWKVSPDPSHN